MTDKQIIIDGCDVSRCECIIEDYQRANNFEGRYEHIKNVCELGERGAEYYNLFCKDNPNCYYKQLKRAEKTMQEIWDRFGKTSDELLRKEQECEELKGISMKKCPKCGEVYLNSVGMEAFNQLDQLKADLLDQEAETLKAGGIIHKLEKTLTEIKEIAEDFYLDGEHVKDKYLAQEILQKISEVEDET